MQKKYKSLISAANEILIIHLLAFYFLFTFLFQAHAAEQSGTIKGTRYSVQSTDLNNDGLEDFLLRGSPTIVVIPLDEDLSIPLLVPPRAPNFLLLSNPSGGYALLENPSKETIAYPWNSKSYEIRSNGPIGLFAESIKIQASAASESVSFTVAINGAGRLQLIQAKNSSGEMNISQPVTGGEITFFHNDASGTPTVSTDIYGNTLWKETYRPFGDRIKNEAASVKNTLWFGGKPYDEGNGLIYMGARYYDPALGRFLGQDPQGFSPEKIHSFNRYLFANNNPYKFVDPDGHSPIDVAFLVYDLGKLGVAAYTGVGVGSAAADVAMSVIGVASPVNADGTFNKTEYLPAAKKVTDEKGNSTIYAFRSYGDPKEQYVMSVAPPNPSANVLIERDATNLVRSVTQAGVSRLYEYNAQLHLTKETNPETGVTAYGRDEAGNITSRATGNSGLTTYRYDDRNRLIEVLYPGDTSPVRKLYTKTDKLKSVSSSLATREFKYDGNDNLIQETVLIDGFNFTIGYSYNQNDQLAQLIYPWSSTVVAYNPDILGRPTTVSGYVNSIAYWPSGLIAQINYSNGTSTTYQQHPRLWPASFEVTRGQTPLQTIRYGYDGVGNLTSISDDVDSMNNRVLSFDSLGRLETARGPWGEGSYKYDGTGNILTQQLGGFTRNYHYDLRNLLTSTSGSRAVSYTYDAHGNVATNGAKVMIYDGVPNLRCADCSALNKTEYGYDGLNQRIWVKKGGLKKYEISNSQGQTFIEYIPGGALTEYFHLGGKRIGQRVSQ